MRLAGLNGNSLNVVLYVFGNTTATAPHFKMESSTRPDLFHPLLRNWFGGSAVVTKFTATLSPADMRKNVWRDLSRAYSEHETRLYSRHGALTTALNLGAGVLALGLLLFCGLTLANETHRPKLPRRISQIALASLALAGLSHLSLPKTEVRLEKGFYRDYNKERNDGPSHRLG